MNSDNMNSERELDFVIRGSNERRLYVQVGTSLIECPNTIITSTEMCQQYYSKQRQIKRRRTLCMYFSGTHSSECIESRTTDRNK